MQLHCRSVKDNIHVMINYNRSMTTHHSILLTVIRYSSLCLQWNTDGIEIIEEIG